MSFENPFNRPPQETTGQKPPHEADKMETLQQGATLEQWLENLSEEQKQIRESILEGNRQHKTINLEPAFEKLLTSTERELWNLCINKVAFGEGELTPAEVKRFGELSVKLGLREKEAKPQAVVEEAYEEVPPQKPTELVVDMFRAEELKNPEAFQKATSERLPGYNLLFRGIKEEWRRPSMSEEEYQKLVQENDELVDWMMDNLERVVDSTEVRRRSERLRGFQELLRKEGDQWFSDNPEVARHYAGERGTVIRVAIRARDVFPYIIGTGPTPGGYGNNFLIPRELFVKSEFLNLEQFRSKKITSKEEAVDLLKDWFISPNFARRRAYLFENAKDDIQGILESDTEYKRLERLLNASPDDPEFHSYAVTKLTEVVRIITPNIRNLEGRELTSSEEEHHRRLLAIRDKYTQAAQYFGIKIEEGV